MQDKDEIRLDTNPVQPDKFRSPVYFIECKGKEPFYVPEACVHK